MTILVSGTGRRFENRPIRAQDFIFGPIREPHLGHVTGSTARLSLGSGTESLGLERARSCMEARLGPEMTSRKPAITSSAEVEGIGGKNIT